MPRPALATYVSTATCLNCHEERYRCWIGSRHALAFASLTPASAEELETAMQRIESKAPCTASASWRIDHLRLGHGTSAECLVCHVTGFNLPGGYHQGGGARNSALAGVGCEACHGPGSDHATAPRELKGTLIHYHFSGKTCRQCHRSTMSPDFDFEVYKSKYAACEE